ncbi:Sugar phosphate permease [Natronorubrum sediminis]|uniref:Sugar phosphate permease n=1 Tax=Natronorubrum sediminis TaxID=640943 RepID=A0A1H6G413_9EURY|nr:MFS transporter [Natronorubrum sediminis]SEH17821.1 Sugar phosphate permease [Natronorubrum sediminis]
MRSSVARRLHPLTRRAKHALNDGRSRIILAVAAGWFLSLGVRMVYPVLLPHIRTAYGLDLTVAGFLLTVLWAAYAIGQFPGGIVTDRIGERITLAVSTLLAGIMLVLVVTAGSALVVFVATALFGLGTALYGVARFTIISKTYPENNGAAIGVTLAAGDLGNAVLPVIAGAVAATFVWQLGLGFVVPLFALVSVVLWFVVPRHTPDGDGDGMVVSLEMARHVVSELQRRSIVVVTLILILGFSISLTLTGFYPTYLIEEKELSSTVAAALFSLYFALGVFVKPLAGSAYDRFGIRQTLPVIFGLAITALLALSVVESLWALVAVTVLLSSLLGNIAVTMPYLTDLLPTEIQGTGLGVLRTTYMLIAALSPSLFGVLADFGYFDEGFVLLAGIAGVMTLLVLLLPSQ